MKSMPIPLSQGRFAVQRLILVTLLLIFSVTTAEEARAQARISAAATVANLNTLTAGGQTGPGLQLAGLYGFSEFWALSADISGSYHFPNEEEELDAAMVSVASLQLRYNIDVFQYIPWIAIGAAGYLDRPIVDGAPAQTNLGAKISLGVDYRRSRSTTIGVFAELHALATDLGRFPVYSQAGLLFAYHFFPL